MADFVVGAADPRCPDVRALVDVHLEFGARHSPQHDETAIDVEALAAPDVSFFGVRDGDVLVGIGALRLIDDGHGEIKSMHTARVARGRGVGKAMVSHLIEVARSRGWQRVSLETGSMAALAPARALYASMGFEICEPFGADEPDPDAVYMTLTVHSMSEQPTRRQPG